MASVAPMGSEASQLCMTGNNQRRPLPCDARIPRSQIRRPQLRSAAAATPVGSVFQARTEDLAESLRPPRGWLAVPSAHAPTVGVPEQLTRDRTGRLCCGRKHADAGARMKTFSSNPEIPEHGPAGAPIDKGTRAPLPPAGLGAPAGLLVPWGALAAAVPRQAHIRAFLGAALPCPGPQGSRAPWRSCPLGPPATLCPRC